jgi:hypothetical protein
MSSVVSCSQVQIVVIRAKYAPGLFGARMDFFAAGKRTAIRKGAIAGIIIVVVIIAAVGVYYITAGNQNTSRLTVTNDRRNIQRNPPPTDYYAYGLMSKPSKKRTRPITTSTYPVIIRWYRVMMDDTVKGPPRWQKVGIQTIELGRNPEMEMPLMELRHYKNWVSGLLDAHSFSQFLKETIEVGFLRLDEYSPVAHDSDCVVASTEGPAKLRSPFHSGELGEGTA